MSAIPHGSADLFQAAPERVVTVNATYGPAPEDQAGAGLSMHGPQVSYDSGNAVGASTITCDEGTGMDFWVRPGTQFWPVMLGWRVVDYDGTSYSYSYDSQPLGTDPVHFDYETQTPPTLHYKDHFRVWRQI